MSLPLACFFLLAANSIQTGILAAGFGTGSARACGEHGPGAVHRHALGSSHAAGNRFKAGMLGGMFHLRFFPLHFLDIGLFLHSLLIVLLHTHTE